jgi:hypothetical protein
MTDRRMVRRLRLATQLRALREESNRGGDAVADALGWSISKVSRVERAKTGIRVEEVERMLDYYEVGVEKRAKLVALAMDAARPGWWEVSPQGLPEDYREYIGLEHEASRIETWHENVVPGLLQTEAYARHVIASYEQVEPVTPAAVGRLVQARMRRQQVLDRDGLQVRVVLDESILHRRVGTPAVMHDQLSRLAIEAGRPNADIRVLPLDAGHTVFGGSFTIFGFGPDNEDDASFPGVVATELLKSSLTFTGELDAYLHRRAFGALSAAALSPAKSRDLILSTASRLGAAANGSSPHSPEVVLV